MRTFVKNICQRGEAGRRISAKSSFMILVIENQKVLFLSTLFGFWKQSWTVQWWNDYNYAFLFCQLALFMCVDFFFLEGWGTWRWCRWEWWYAVCLACTFCAIYNEQKLFHIWMTPFVCSFKWSWENHTIGGSCFYILYTDNKSEHHSACMTKHTDDDVNHCFCWHLHV